MTSQTFFTSFLCSIFLICTCHNAPNTSQISIPKFNPEYEGAIVIHLPQFLSCPFGWSMKDFDAGQGHVLPYCDPPVFDYNNNNLTPRAALFPNFLPCPQGWTPVEDEVTGIVICHPFPEEGPKDCDGIDEIDKIHFAGETGCVRIGTECPEGLYAENLPIGSSPFYVKAGAPSGGDGAISNPFGSINEALEHVGTDALLVLSKGTFHESVELPRGIVLWGACVAETVVTPSVTSEQEAVITSRNPDTEVRNLQITGERWGVFVSGTLSSLHLEDVVINETQVVGIEAYQCLLTLKNVVVRNTLSRQPDETFGIGLEVSGGAKVEVMRSVFQKNREIGVNVLNVGTRVHMQDVVVRDTMSRQRDGTLGRGLQVFDGAEITVMKAVFKKNREVGIIVSQAGTIVNMEDTVILDTLSRQSDGKKGIGLYVTEGAVVGVMRTAFQNNREVGVIATKVDTTVRIEDVVIWDTQSRQSDGIGGRGLEVSEGADLEVTSTVFQKNREIGVAAFHKGTTLLIEDVVIRNTLSQERDGTFGRGLQASDGSEVEILRTVFQNNREFGVSVGGSGTTVHMEDVVIRDTSSRLSDGKTGEGLQVSYGAEVEVTRTVFQNNREDGISAYHDGTRLIMKDIIVSNTLKRQCASIDREKSQPSCYGIGAGTGIATFGGALIDLERFVLSHNTHCGAVLAFGGNEDGSIFEIGGRIHLSNGIVSNNELCGVNIQTDNFDLDQLDHNVLFFGNNYNNLDTQKLPVPSLATPCQPTPI